MTGVPATINQIEEDAPHRERRGAEPHEARRRRLRIERIELLDPQRRIRDDPLAHRGDER